MTREKDGRIKRLWYLPNKWSQKEPKLDDWSDLIKDQKIFNNWNKVEKKVEKDEYWNKINKYPHIFLCRAPLTFGHSQLVIPHPGKKIDNEPISIKEEKYFEWASVIIKSTIAVFNMAFKDKEIDIEKEFKNLAKLTLTEDKYIKTLILKASADEEATTNNETKQYNLKEYKVHLVPYFESHAKRCKELYQSLHDVTCTEKGGLLKWLGEMENKADGWEKDLSPYKYKINKRDKYSLDDIANHDLKMPALAKELRRTWRNLK